LNLKDIILDILFPRFCLGCGKEGGYICPSCSLYVSEALLICPVCFKESFSGETHPSCREKYGLDGLVSIWQYDGIIKEAIKNAEAGGAYDILRELTQKSFKIIATDPSRRFDDFLSFLSSGETLVSFVPMRKIKESKRGFNQSEVIAKELAKIIGRSCVSSLQKIKHTEDQASLKKEARLQNVKNCFSPIKNEIKNEPGSHEPGSSKKDIKNLKNVVLVDDVFTTGATMRECCRVLKQNGVQKVWAFSLAHPSN